MKLLRSLHEVCTKFDPLSSIRNYHKLAYVRSSPEVAFNFIQNCPNFVQSLTKFPSEVRAKLARSLREVRAKLARSSCEVGPKLVRSWPEVRAKWARSSCEVGPKFVRSGPKVRTKFCSEVRFEM